MGFRRLIAALLLGEGVLIVLLLAVVEPSRARLWAGGIYTDSGQNLGGGTTYDVALADVDDDLDLDVLAANGTGVGNRLWLNNGSGIFDTSVQTAGNQDSRGVALGDLDGMNGPDAFVANFGADNEVWLNNGSGVFVDTGQTMNPLTDSLDVVLARLDGDLDLDAFVANDGANEVWVNDGSGFFTKTQTLGGGTSREAAVGDVDGDLDLDIYVANGNTSAQADELWFNDGAGVFTPTAQILDTSWNEGVALGFLNNDAYLDVYLATWFGADAVWLNDGNGNFTDSGQTLSGNGSLDVVLEDVDNDTDLDAIVAKWTPDADEIWLNNGNGVFTLSGETLDTGATYEIAAGDLDGDFDNDLFFGNFGANQVWFRGGSPPPNPWFAVDARVNPNGQTVYPWAQAGEASLPVQLDSPPLTPINVLARIELAGGVSTTTLPFSAGQINGTLSVANPSPTISEMLTITLSSQSSFRGLLGGLYNPLNLVFIESGAGNMDCSLCFVDWLVKLLGFDYSFWTLFQMQLPELRDTPSWYHYGGLFSDNAQELSTIMATHPSLLWDTFDVLETWTPALQAVEDGQGSTITISQSMVDEGVVVIEGIRDNSNPDLAAVIQSELDILDPDSLVGLNMDEAVARIADRVYVFMPVVHRP